MFHLHISYILYERCHREVEGMLGGETPAELHFNTNKLLKWQVMAVSPSPPNKGVFLVTRRCLLNNDSANFLFFLPIHCSCVFVTHPPPAPLQTTWDHFLLYSCHWSHDHSLPKYVGYVQSTDLWLRGICTNFGAFVFVGKRTNSVCEQPDWS